jgi:hypothetical protein
MRTISPGGAGRASLHVSLLLALAACVEAPELFAPEGGLPPPVLALGTDTLTVREGDRLALRIKAHEAVRAEILLVDSTRAVLWRSGTSERLRDSASFVFAGLPVEVARARRVFLTGSLVDGAGRRVFATTDTAPAPSLARAALRPVVVYEGKLLPVDGRVVALAAARDLGRVYFADQARGRVGTVELATLTLGTGFAAGAQPEALAYTHGRLGVLSNGGVELAAFDVAAGGRLLSSTVLPPLVARVAVPSRQTDASGRPVVQTYRYQVRPYARNLALVCTGGAPGCAEVAAFGSSDMVDPVSGSGGTGLRQIGFAGRAAIPLLVAPVHDLATTVRDSTAASLVLLDAALPTGRDSVVHTAEGVGRCGLLTAGGAAVAASPLPGGPVYVGLDPRGSECDPEVPLIRLDRAVGPLAAVSVLAYRNLLGENRIQETRALDVSEDGSRLLVLDRDRVHLLDDVLRLRASLAVPGARAAAWLRDAGPASRFAVVVGDAVEVYGAADLVLQGRTVLGPLSGQIAFVRAGGANVVVAVPRDARGVLVARIP